MWLSTKVDLKIILFKKQYSIAKLTKKYHIAECNANTYIYVLIISSVYIDCLVLKIYGMYNIICRLTAEFSVMHL